MCVVPSRDYSRLLTREGIKVTNLQQPFIENISTITEDIIPRETNIRKDKQKHCIYDVGSMRKKTKAAKRKLIESTSGSADAKAIPTPSSRHQPAPVLQ